MKTHLLSTVIASFTFLIGSTSAFASGQNHQQGIDAYNHGDYRHAVIVLDKSLAASPDDPEAWYYRALSYVKSGCVKEAKTAYEDVILHCKDTEEAKLAVVGLKQLNQIEVPVSSGAKSAINERESSGKQTSTPIAGQAPSSSDSLPEVCSVPYTSDSYSRPHVLAKINGSAVSVTFDTGADEVVVPQNLAEANNIRLPTLGAPDGVYKKTGSKIWKVAVDLEVGDIKRSHFPILVFETGPWPGAILLGNSFYSGYNTSQDSKSERLIFKRQVPGGASAERPKDTNARYSYKGGMVVPFRAVGSKIIITCKLNGKQVEVLFDTGATNSLSCTTKQLDALAVPPGPVASRGKSIIPASYYYMWFDIDFGPFHFNDVKGIVFDGDQATWGTDYPLIAPDLFESQGYSWSIDRGSNVLILEKK